MLDSLWRTQAIDPEWGTQIQKKHNSRRRETGYKAVNFWLWENE
jgi:hypothetical protein